MHRLGVVVLIGSLFAVSPLLADSMGRPEHVLFASDDGRRVFRLEPGDRGTLYSVNRRGDLEQLWTATVPWSPSACVSSNGTVAVLTPAILILGEEPAESVAIAIYRDGKKVCEVTTGQLIADWTCITATLGFFLPFRTPLPYFERQVGDSGRVEERLIVLTTDLQELSIDIASGVVTAIKPHTVHSANGAYRLTSSRQGTTLEHLTAKGQAERMWHKPWYAARPIVSNDGLVARVGRWPLHQAISKSQLFIALIDVEGRVVREMTQEDLIEAIPDTPYRSQERGVVQLQEYPSPRVVFTLESAPEVRVTVLMKTGEVLKE